MRPKSGYVWRPPRLLFSAAYLILLQYQDGAVRAQSSSNDYASGLGNVIDLLSASLKWVTNSN